MDTLRITYAVGVGILSGLGANVAGIEPFPDTANGLLGHVGVALGVGLVTYSRGRETRTLATQDALARYQPGRHASAGEV